MIMKILTFPDPRLREVAEPVKLSEFGTPELKKLQEDMIETMYDAHGIGLAAPQVGELVRMIVIDTRPKDDKGRRYKDQEMTDLEKAVEQPLVLINPEIVKGEGKTTFDEGCLSVPGYYETVERYDYIEMKAFDVNGKEFIVKTDGLLAICMQHELDHLEGTLFIDHLSFVKSNKIKKQIQKHGYPTKEEMERARSKQVEGNERE
ncbi:peptide deformylase [Bdellovibrio sp. SKB1291214]|uniref:peptide deformylase n=1 Tax=Bdellovibrio sp. SKB1291214 TaxID=1732569 RepID=UPI000B516224|nr:peptide deformylase [Bdellovibrio sp. SKB1291214]UYL07489.1 peptide deformylase [Bdellovibrio sp. SKB1291214]